MSQVGGGDPSGGAQIKPFPAFSIVGTEAEWRTTARIFKSASESMDDIRGRLVATIGALEHDWQGWAANQFRESTQKLAGVAFDAGDALDIMSGALNSYADEVKAAVDGYLKAERHYKQHKAQGDESGANAAVAAADTVIGDWTAAATRAGNTLSGTGVPGGISFGTPHSAAEDAYGNSLDDSGDLSALNAWFKSLNGTFKVWGGTGWDGEHPFSHIPGYREWFTAHHENISSAVGDLFTFFLTLAGGLGLVRDIAEGSITQLAKDLGVKVAKDESEDDIRDAVATRLKALLGDSAARAKTLTTIFTSAAKGGAEKALQNSLVQSQAVDQLNNLANSVGIPIPPKVETAIEDIVGAHDDKSARALLHTYAHELSENVTDDVKEKVDAAVATILNDHT